MGLDDRSPPPSPLPIPLSQGLDPTLGTTFLTSVLKFVKSYEGGTFDRIILNELWRWGVFIRFPVPFERYNPLVGGNYESHRLCGIFASLPLSSFSLCFSLSLFSGIFFPLVCPSHHSPLAFVVHKLATGTLSPPQVVLGFRAGGVVLTIIVKSVGKVAFFTSSFPSSPRRWPSVDQNVNVCARNCSVISQHWIRGTEDI